MAFGLEAGDVLLGSDNRFLKDHLTPGNKINAMVRRLERYLLDLGTPLIGASAGNFS